MRTIWILVLLSSVITVSQAQSEKKYAEPATRSPMVVVTFTGQRCRYCPNCMRGLLERQKEYGEKNYLIAALHHLKSYSLLPGNHVSLYHPETEEYAKSIGMPKGLPFFYYNTLGKESSDLELKDMYKEDDLLECSGEVFYNNNNEYVVDIQTLLRSNQKEFVEGREVDILLWALENDVVALQDDNGKWTMPKHQHIFRGSINGLWGEPFTIGESYKKTLPIPSSVKEKSASEVMVLLAL